MQPIFGGRKAIESMDLEHIGSLAKLGENWLSRKFS